MKEGEQDMEVIDFAWPALLLTSSGLLPVSWDIVDDETDMPIATPKQKSNMEVDSGASSSLSAGPGKATLVLELVVADDGKQEGEAKQEDTEGDYFFDYYLFGPIWGHLGRFGPRFRHRAGERDRGKR